MDTNQKMTTRSHEENITTSVYLIVYLFDLFDFSKSGGPCSNMNHLGIHLRFRKTDHTRPRLRTPLPTCYPIINKRHLIIFILTSWR